MEFRVKYGKTLKNEILYVFINQPVVMGLKNGIELALSAETCNMTVKPNLFLVDDDPFCLAMYEQHLHNLGFTEVQLFQSGNELLDNLHQTPDLVFLDYNLGDYKGLELLHAIKSLRPTAAVVILSGQQDMDITIKLMNKGAFDYIIKDEWATERITDVMGKYMATAEYREQVSDWGNNQTGHKYLNLIAEAQEKVRQEISSELHDNISQLLGVSKLYIDSAKNDEHNRLNLLDESKNILESAIQEVRQLSHNLHAAASKNSALCTSFEKLVQQLEQNGVIVNNEMKSKDFEHLSENELQQLLRVFQELMNNMIKYAKATQVYLQTEMNEQELIWTIRDNGIGFDVATAKQGIGLENISRRIATINGIGNLQTAPGKGCTWTIRIPVKQTKATKSVTQEISFHI
jgi:signal transduction histidine kinase